MKLDVHRRLRALAEAQGMAYGKLVQKLLAIAFLEAGAKRVTERSTQGVDLEVELEAGERVALEVKTAQETVHLAPKDVRGLAAREAEGYAAYVAVLGARLFDDWIFARYHEGEIAPGSTNPPTRFRAWRDRALEARVAESFPAAVEAHAARAAQGGQPALDEVLRGYDAFHPA